MYPKPFEYTRAESVEHAIELLGQLGEDAKLLAGGASLLPLMKLRLATPAHVVDLGPLAPRLSGVTRQNGTFTIGAMTRHFELEGDAALLEVLPIVHDAASHIGDVQVRNMGTIGGGLAECDPAGDWPPVFLALGGSVKVQGPAGERMIPATELFLDAYTTSLAHNEVMTEVLLPAPTGRFGAAHLKIERRAGDFAIANCSVAVSFDAHGRCESIGIGLGGVGLCPFRVTAAEQLLAGQVPTDELLAEAAHTIENSTESFSDVRGGEDYRRHLGGVVFRRAFDLARQRALGTDREVSGGR